MHTPVRDTTTRRAGAVLASLLAGAALSVSVTACDPVPPPCDAAGLALSVVPKDAAAGHHYAAVVFTNTGAAPCVLDGHPGVSALDVGGTQVGLPAEWDPAFTVVTGPVTLLPGATASALLATSSAFTWDPSLCGPVRHGVLLRAYPPGSLTSRTVGYENDVCTSLANMRVGPVQPGTDPKP